MKTLQLSITAISIFISIPLLADDPLANGNWPSAGGGIHNRRSTTDGPRKSDVGRLQQDWVFTAGGDISATPTVEGNSLYVPDWGGFLYKIDTRTGAALWSHKISDYTGDSKSVSRTSPAISGDKLVIGDQASATVIAVDKNSGNLIWQQLLDPNPCGRITSSVVIAEGKIYVGLSCTDEGAYLFTKGYISTFRGSMAALDVATGKVAWQTYLLPAVPSGYPANTPWYSGVPIWASTAAVDVATKTVFIGTGNNYATPPDVAQCILNAGPDPADQSACLAPDDYEDSVLAFDMDTGAIKWSRRLQAFDTWTAACLPNLPAGFSQNPCPVPAGGDFRFRLRAKPVHGWWRRRRAKTTRNWPEERRLLGARSQGQVRLSGPRSSARPKTLAASSGAARPTAIMFMLRNPITTMQAIRFRPARL